MRSLTIYSVLLNSHFKILLPIWFNVKLLLLLTTGVLWCLWVRLMKISLKSCGWLYTGKEVYLVLATACRFRLVLALHRSELSLRLVEFRCSHTTLPVFCSHFSKTELWRHCQTYKTVDKLTKHDIIIQYTPELVYYSCEYYTFYVLFREYS